MQKKALVATLSMALVLGVAGIVNAATMGGYVHNSLSQPSTTTAYMAPNNVRSLGNLQGTTQRANQLNPGTPTSSNEPNNQIQNMPGYLQMQKAPVSTPMSTNTSNNQIQNMPGYTHMTTLTNTPMNGPMINFQNQQSGTYRSNQVNAPSTTQQPGRNSNVRSMMGSMGRMGR